MIPQRTMRPSIAHLSEQLSYQLLYNKSNEVGGFCAFLKSAKWTCLYTSFNFDIKRAYLVEDFCRPNALIPRLHEEANMKQMYWIYSCTMCALSLFYVCFMYPLWCLLPRVNGGVIYCVVNSWAFICKITAICTMLHRCRNSRLACVFPCTFRTVGIRSASHAFAICQRSVTHEALCTTSRPDVIMTYGRSVVYDLSSVTLRCPRCGGRDRTFIHTLMKLSFRWLLPSTSARHRRGGVDF